MQEILWWLVEPCEVADVKKFVSRETANCQNGECLLPLEAINCRYQSICKQTSFYLGP
jgi:hypothetical protein